MDEVLRIRDLTVSFELYNGYVSAVRGVSLTIRKGEILALVGESGCGKSVTARSILKLNDTPNIQMSAAELWLDEVDILSATEKEMLQVRGNKAGMIFQDPLTYLNPTMKVGKQVTEALFRQGKKTAAQCKQEAVRLLSLVQIPDPEIRSEQFPHQYSGGMRQRAMIAMALACNPSLLIADEPTTALDPTIQLQILMLLKRMQKENQLAVLMITHDLSVVANVADTVAVMYAGKIVEESSVAALFDHPCHPYTKGLLSSLPSRETNQQLFAIPGAPPDLYAPPEGCAFAPRCSSCMAICRQEQPPEIENSPGHKAACWLLHPDCPKGDR